MWRYCADVKLAGSEVDEWDNSHMVTRGVFSLEKRERLIRFSFAGAENFWSILRLIGSCLERGDGVRGARVFTRLFLRAAANLSGYN